MVLDERRVILGIDMDDVTADLNEMALMLYNRDHPNSPLTKEDLDDWYGNWDLLKEYYTREDIYRELPVIEGSVEVLEELSRRNYHIVFVTASPTPKATLAKLEWVDKHFPFIGSNNVIATRHKHLIKADLLFDDSPEFLPRFEGYRVLMDRIYNQHLKVGDHYEVRVRDWGEFLKVIEMLEDEGYLNFIK